jgi:hypothetical protein
VIAMTRLTRIAHQQAALVATMVEILAVGPGRAGLAVIVATTLVSAGLLGAPACLYVFLATVLAVAAFSYWLARAEHAYAQYQQLAERARDNARHLALLVPATPSAGPLTGSGHFSPFNNPLPAWTEFEFVLAGVWFLLHGAPAVARVPARFLLLLCGVGGYLITHQHPDTASTCGLIAFICFVLALLTARYARLGGAVVLLLFASVGFALPALFTLGGN